MKSNRLKQWNEEQIKLSQSAVNRYFYWRATGKREATNSELLIYFIENGGANQFRKEHNEQQKPSTKTL